MTSLWSRPLVRAGIVVVGLLLLPLSACSSSGSSPSSAAALPSSAAAPSSASASTGSSCADLVPDLEALQSTLTSQETSVSDKAQAVRTALAQLLPAIRSAGAGLSDHVGVLVRALGSLAAALADPQRSSASVSSAVGAVTDAARSIQAFCSGSGTPSAGAATS